MGGKKVGKQKELKQTGEGKEAEKPCEEVVSDINTEVQALRAELEKAQAKAEELMKIRKREQAEFENFKKRRIAEQERHEKMALRSLMLELIEVDSNFSHALNGGEADFGAYRNGVDMIAKQFAGVLERHGVVRIDALGQPFDHDFHEAMLQVEEGDHEGLKVVAVLREGYMIHDQVLRLSGVKVAKGSAGAESSDEEEVESSEEDDPAE